MQIRCTYCQTMFAISRENMLAALEHMDEEKLKYYDAHCPKCRRANRVERFKLELAYPRWRADLKEMAKAAPAAEGKPAAQKPVPQAAKVEQPKAKAAAIKSAAPVSKSKAESTKAKAPLGKTTATSVKAKAPAPKTKAPAVKAKTPTPKVSKPAASGSKPKATAAVKTPAAKKGTPPSKAGATKKK